MNKPKERKKPAKNSFHFQLLPSEILLGVKTINSQVVFEDDKMSPCYGIEIGFIFITLLYMRIA